MAESDHVEVGMEGVEEPPNEAPAVDATTALDAGTADEAAPQQPMDTQLTEATDGNGHTAEDKGEEQGAQAAAGQPAEPSAGASPELAARRASVDPLTQPPHGTEVFISNIPHEASDEEIKAFAAQAGEVFAARIPRHPPGPSGSSPNNRGFAFIVYTTQATADQAVAALHNQELPEHAGRKLRVVMAEAKNKLYVGNVLRTLTKQQVEEAIRGEAPGVEEVTVLQDAVQQGCNRGFAFVTFYNYAAADLARKKLDGFNLQGRSLRVTWAEPSKSEASEQVKSIYVGALPETTTDDKLRQLFQAYGQVERVFLPTRREAPDKHRDYGFVHFAERSSAVSAVDAAATSPLTLDGKEVTVAMAKPQGEAGGGGRGDNTYAGYGSYAPRGGAAGGGSWGGGRGAAGGGGGRGGYASSRHNSSYAYESGGYEGGEYEEEGYAEEGAGYGSYGYAAAATPAAGVTMMPVLLPTGQVGYVMTSAAGVAASAGGPVRRAAGSTGSGYGGGGRGYGGGSRQGSSYGGGRGGSRGYGSSGRGGYAPY